MRGEDFYSVGQAARALRLVDGRIRQMLRSGELKGERDQEGAPWRIPMHAVHDFSEKRPGRTPFVFSSLVNLPIRSEYLGRWWRPRWW